ncbi:hypothetical protein RISK_003462 [Rhodopirellula islandica]|uniref:Uncharacterized protein n=1 Tax=Rhodopirellula islandica TaxID=595434 RepID=A0A0J1BCW0_RHOIS|nr:hypothetical protein RISK_003462 [Rhodopirellula islandica]
MFGLCGWDRRVGEEPFTATLTETVQMPKDSCRPASNG